jgi:hypothetical protein
VSETKAGHSLGETVATLTVMRGEIERLPGLLENLEWCAERHFVETGPSLDVLRDIRDIERHHHPLPLGAAFDAARGTALPHVRAPWILVVDTDERLPTSLLDYLALQLPRWDIDGVEAVWLPRRNHVLGEPLRFSSAWPDYQMRVFRREAARFTNQIHGFVPAELKHQLRVPAMDALAIQHFNFETTTDFVTKLNLYSGIEADQSRETTAPSVSGALYRATREFAVRYLKMKGFRDGAEGLHYALMLGMYRYLIEAKRWEKKGR